MDSMSMSNSSSSDSSMIMIMMIPYLHFTKGDFLYFKSWQPSSDAAVAGACIGLVALAILERWVHGMRGVLEDVWRRRTIALMAGGHKETQGSVDDVRKSASISIKEDGGSDEAVEASTLPADTKGNQHLPVGRRSLPPFIASHELPRGAIFMLQSTLGYALMLAVMSFQAAYVISILAGLGIGEILFGRLGYASLH